MPPKKQKPSFRLYVTAALMAAVVLTSLFFVVRNILQRIERFREGSKYAQYMKGEGARDMGRVRPGPEESGAVATPGTADGAGGGGTPPTGREGVVAEISRKMAHRHFERGKDALHRGDWKAAAADLETAVELNPKDGKYLLLRARARFELGAYDGTIADADAVLRQDPAVAEAWYLHGLAHERSNFAIFYKVALADLTKAIELDPQAGKYYFRRGLIYERKADYKNAIDDYTAAIEHNAEAGAACFRRACARYCTGALSEAAQDFARAVRLAPSNGEAWFYLGYINYRWKNYGEAIEAFSRAIRAEPRNGLAWYYRSEAWHAIGEFDRSVQDHRRFAELRPADRYRVPPVPLPRP